MIVIDHVDYWSLSEAYHLDRLHASVITDWYPRYIHKPGALNIKQNVLSMLQETGRDWSLIQHADIEMKAKLIFIIKDKNSALNLKYIPLKLPVLSLLSDPPFSERTPSKRGVGGARPKTPKKSALTPF